MSDSTSSVVTPSTIPRGARKQRLRLIPVVNAQRMIVGWINSDSGPEGLVPRHSGAEALVGGPIRCAYIQISDLADAKRAGAPDDWNREWQCLAICSEQTISSNFESGVIHLARSSAGGSTTAPPILNWETDLLTASSGKVGS